MKLYLLVLFLISMLIVGCGDSEPENIPAGMHKVEVLEAMNASSYTYMRVEEGGNEYWIAVPQMNAKEGDVFYYSKSLEMQNFSSSTLNKTFDKILFVEDISQAPGAENNKMGAMGSTNPHSQVISGKQNVKVDPLSDGQTVEKIYQDKEALSGKAIKVRGVVTKFNPGILDRNWIHIQDGTGFNDKYDLTITSDEEVVEGKTVVISGTVALNKDFGNGYAYDVLIENATIKAE